jgi:hypothetical protein
MSYVYLVTFIAAGCNKRIDSLRFVLHASPGVFPSGAEYRGYHHVIWHAIRDFGPFLLTLEHNLSTELNDSRR